MVERNEANDFSNADVSPLAQRAANIAQALPLESLKNNGISRDRAKYFLNIVYPSLQVMNEVMVKEVYPKNKSNQNVSLYIHVPFCADECHYCHYYKEFNKPPDEVDKYINGIDQELGLLGKNFQEIITASIYIGGGTPSYMDHKQIDQLFGIIRKHVEISDGIEISFEMHPENVTVERLEVLKNVGVNRISLGVESFDDEILRAENRRHTTADVEKAIDMIQKAGFRNINLDLIYGLRNQDLTSWNLNLDYLAKLQPPSVTMYYLRLKKGTPEYKLWLKNPNFFASDSDLLLMHIMSFEKMVDLGYTQNPVDWFIKNPDDFHKYQQFNWRDTDNIPLIGLGPSAYSYINGWQYYNINSTKKWLEQVEKGQLPIWKGECLSGDEPMRRTIMLGLKIGIDREKFRKTYNTDVIEAFPEVWERLYKLDLIKIDEKTIELTYLGKLYADEVGQQFYSDTMKKRMALIDPELVSTTWPKFNP